MKRMILSTPWTTLPAVWASMSLLLLSTPAHAGSRYIVNLRQSSIIVRSQESGLVNATRSLQAMRFNGYADVSQDIKPLDVSFTIMANSFVAIGNLNSFDRDKIDGAVKNPILEADTYPEIEFRSTHIAARRSAGGQYTGTLWGKLTLHGKTRVISFPVFGKISKGLLTARGQVTINQSDYNITLLSLVGGAIAIKDPVTMQFNIVAKG
jgi:polyisoprenoid-binding protein YceI